MRKELAAVLAAGVMLVGGAAFTATSAVAGTADHYPAVGWQVRDANADGSRPDAAKSEIVNATTVKLTRDSATVGTSIETTNLNLGVDSAEKLTVAYALSGEAATTSGAIRMFIYNKPDGNTMTEAPFAVAIAEGAADGKLEIPLNGVGKIGTMGLVYDASNGSTGTVTFSNLSVGDQKILFVKPLTVTLAPTTTPPPTPTATPNGLSSQINGLKVAAEQDAGYARTLFGNSPTAAQRAAELKRNYDLWPSCVGYYSFADNKCYVAASEVDIDHKVALKEAWGSGARTWTPEKRKAFAGDAVNYWVMTDNLNASKGDDDLAEWNPPYNGADCYYARTYVSVKVKYRLSVDTAEKTALLAQASKCSGAAPAPSLNPVGNGTGNGGSLPVTGSSWGTMMATAAGGVLLIAGGGLLLVLARRRRDADTVESA